MRPPLDYRLRAHGEWSVASRQAPRSGTGSGIDRPHTSPRTGVAPLTSHELVLNTITTTELKVDAALDHGAYPTGIAVSRDQLTALPITAQAVHSLWNYSIAPTGGPSAAPRRQARRSSLTDPRDTRQSACRASRAGGMVYDMMIRIESRSVR
ncbi:ISAzo13-like element transposase-related protein [Micromonospora sp. NPDC003197]